MVGRKIYIGESYDRIYDKEMNTRKELQEFLKGFKNKYMDNIIRFKFKGMDYDIFMFESYRGVLKHYALCSDKEELDFKTSIEVINYLCKNTK